MKGKDRKKKSRFEVDLLLSIPGGDEDGIQRPGPRFTGPISNPNPVIQNTIPPPSRYDTRDEA